MAEANDVSAAPALTFVPLDDAGLEIYAAWFIDAELRRRLEAPTPQWYAFVRETPGQYAWLIYAGDDPVGHVHFGMEVDGCAGVSLAVRPDARGRGYGQAILRALLGRPEVAGVRVIMAGIAADNFASLRCFTAVGFVPTSATPDADGFLELLYMPPSP